MTLRLKLVGSQFASVLSADDETKEEFYTNLDQVLSGVPEGYRLILLGVFNARAGKDSMLWNEIIGKEGVGKVNSNGILLLINVRNTDSPSLIPCSDRRTSTRHHGNTPSQALAFHGLRCCPYPGSQGRLHHPSSDWSRRLLDRSPAHTLNHVR